MKNQTPMAHALCPTPLGDLLLACTPQGLSGAWFAEGQHATPSWQAWGAAGPNEPVLAQAARQLGEYFAGQRQRFDLPLDLSSGTPFQQSVWRELLTIDAGAARSYTQVAERIGRPSAVRAVGTAIGANPLSVIVPCHRALGRHGALSGYAGGLARKLALLRLEGWHVEAPAASAEPRGTWRAHRATA